MKRNIIFIGGINGSGKTSVLNELGKRTGLPIFEGSHNLMKILGIPNDYERLRNLSVEQKIQGQVDSFRSISENNNEAIATSHFVQVINGTSADSIGDWFVYCKLLVHLISRPEEIFKRVHSENRDRSLFISNDISDAEKIYFLKQAQDQSLEVARRISKEQGIPLLIIENNSIDQAVEEILNIV